MAIKEAARLKLREEKEGEVNRVSVRQMCVHAKERRDGV